jgi:hypothetical protein
MPTNKPTFVDPFDQPANSTGVNGPGTPSPRPSDARIFTDPIDAAYLSQQPLSRDPRFFPERNPTDLESTESQGLFSDLKSVTQGLFSDLESVGKRALLKILTEGPEMAEAGYEGLRSGVLWGGADEIDALNDTVKQMIRGHVGDFGSDFSRNLDARFKAQEALRESQPAMFNTSEIGGAFGTGLASAPVNALSRLGFLKGLLTGGAYGATAGALSDNENRELGAAIGGGLGLGVGAVAPAISGIMGKVTGKTAPSAGRAGELLDEVAEIDRLTLPEAMRRAVVMGKDSILADVGRGFRGLGENVALMSNANRAIAEDALDSRARKARQRILDSLDSTLGVSAGLYDRLDALKLLAKDRARPIYEAAYNDPVDWTPTLRRIWESDIVSEQIWPKLKKRGLDQMAARDVDFDPRSLGHAVPSMEGWDMIKRELDIHIERELKESKTRARELIAIKNNLLKELDRKQFGPGPDGLPVEDLSNYGVARRIYSTAAHAERMVQHGRDFLKGEYERTASNMAKWSDVDKHLFRLGVSRQLRSMLDRQGDLHDVAKVFQKPVMRDQLRAVFPDTRSFIDFMNTVYVEGQRTASRKAILGNSATAKRLHGVLSLKDKAGDVGRAAVTEGFPSAARTALRSLRSDDIPAAATSRLAEILFEVDDAKRAALVRELQRQMPSATLGLRFAGGGGAAAGVGSQ